MFSTAAGAGKELMSNVRNMHIQCQTTLCHGPIKCWLTCEQSSFLLRAGKQSYSISPLFYSGARQSMRGSPTMLIELSKSSFPVAF
jgi:hypothetical protein